MRFRRLKEYPGYRIYEHGEIFSEKTNKFLKKTKSTRGYYRIVLMMPGGKRSISLSIARLTLTAWFGDCPKGLCCAHLDGDKENNHYTNLKWVTYKENDHHKLLHGTRVMGFKHPASKLTPAQANYILKNYKRPSYGCSNAKALGKKFGVSATTVTNLVLGTTYISEDLK